MKNKIELSQQTLTEAMNLSQDILDDFELSRNRIENIYYKVSRLARILNDFETQKLIQYEIAGYTGPDNALTPEVYNLAALTGRERIKENNNGRIEKKVVSSSIGLLESQIESDRMRLSVAVDPNVSLSSANPKQFLISNTNKRERDTISARIFENNRVISASKAYMLNVNYLYRLATIIFAGFPQKNYLSSPVIVKLIFRTLAAATL